MQRRILILGNSHSQAIKDNSPLPAGVDVYWMKSKKENAPGDIDIPRAYDLAADLTPDDFLVVMWLGTLHNVAGLLNHTQPFALLDGHDGGAGTDLVPEAAMRAYIGEVLGRDRLLPRLRKAVPCRMGHVMPPPPKEDPAALTVKPKMYRGIRISDVGFAPARQRLAFWSLEQRVLSDHLRGLGITPVVPPPDTVTERGFLHPDYSAADVTHANAAYGARLLDHIRATLQGAAAPQAAGA